ncbi:molybdate ABC transporter substrate-binding protein [Nesterenkonia halotolerans]|uniref:molybdate ABC transporter substrate-binding protein n=1 Tax=Nesterenkonia halotolerans TaxID=225325 RepID=UPI003EE55A75
MKPDSLFFRLRGVIALVLLLCFVAAFVLSACGPAYEVPAGEARSASVIAAPSTKPALDQLDSTLQERNSTLSAEVEYLDTEAMVERIDAAPQADVVLTASREQMQDLDREGHISGDPLPLASNRLVLVATAENPQNILHFEDFAERVADLRVSTCAADAPCTTQVADLVNAYELDLGASDATLARASTTDGPQTPQTPLTDLGAGRSDAALAYVTDALAQDTPLQTFEVPASERSTAEVWAGVLEKPQDDAAAGDFFEVLAGEDARSAFSEAGFLPPPSAEMGASSH